MAELWFEPRHFCSRVQVLSSCNILFLFWFWFGLFVFVINELCVFWTPNVLLAQKALFMLPWYLSSSQSWALVLPAFFSLICPTCCYQLKLNSVPPETDSTAQFLMPYYNLIVDWWESVFPSLHLIASSLKQRKKKKALLFSPWLLLKC